MTKCKNCANTFTPKRNSKGLYCSYSCYWESKKGATPWNKGKTSIYSQEALSKMRDAKLGKYVADKHHNWKGEDVAYSTLHWWVIKHKGNPERCSKCGRSGQKRNGIWTIEWANKDHKYKRALDDFIALCKSCHVDYDLAM